MKKGKWFEIFMFLGIGIWFIVLALGTTHQHNEQMDKLDEIHQDIIERNHVDSLYHDHMSKCSYILQDQVTVGHGGVLYSEYHKK